MDNDLNTLSAVETFDYGIMRQYMQQDKGQIVIIRTEGDMSDAAVDLWANTVIDSVKNWPAGQDIFILHDLSSRTQGLTPYARKRAGETYEYVPDDVSVTIAIVLADGILNRLIQLLLRLPGFNRPNVEQQIFMSEDRAEAWLLSRMERLAALAMQ